MRFDKTSPRPPQNLKMNINKNQQVRRLFGVRHTHYSLHITLRTKLLDTLTIIGSLFLFAIPRDVPCSWSIVIMDP